MPGRIEDMGGVGRPGPKVAKLAHGCHNNNIYSALLDVGYARPVALRRRKGGSLIPST